MADLKQAGSLWIPEEDALLVRHVAKYGTRHWSCLQATGCLPHRDQKACCNRFILLKRKFLRARAAGQRMTFPLQPTSPTKQPKPEPQSGAKIFWSQEHSEVHLPRVNSEERPAMATPARQMKLHSSALQRSSGPSSSLPLASLSSSWLSQPPSAKRVLKPSLSDKAPSTQHSLLHSPEHIYEILEFDAIFPENQPRSSSTSFAPPAGDRVLPLRTQDSSVTIGSSSAPASEYTWAPAYGGASAETWPAPYACFPTLSLPLHEVALPEATILTYESLQQAHADLTQLSSSELLSSYPTQIFGYDSGLVSSTAPEPLLETRSGSLLYDGGLNSSECWSQQQMPMNLWNVEVVNHPFN